LPDTLFFVTAHRPGILRETCDERQVLPREKGKTLRISSNFVPSRCQSKDLLYAVMNNFTGKSQISNAKAQRCETASFFSEA
jgi:hypothetical protein